MAWKLIWPVILLTLLPLGVSWFVYPTHLPPEFGVFPPQIVQDNPPFLWWYFLIVLALILAVALLFVAPRVFGFKPPASSAPAVPRKPLPWWFWAGGIVMAFSWWLMWARPESLRAIVPYAFTPLWWGFIFLLDGVVYRRNNGISLAATKPVLLAISVVVSLIGWLYFEYFDYFVLSNWYYPQVDVLEHWLTVIVFLLAYTTVWPVVFEWYNLLNTFPRFAARYADGPRVRFNGTVLMLIGYVLMCVMVVWPLGYFWAIWIGPMLVFSGLLVRLGIDNPVSAMAEGNWAPALLIALACFLNGFVWEMWNYGSTHPLEPITNPNYWKYDIPYVNILHFKSEMPLLGYFGYMPFGVLVWQFMIWAGQLFRFDSDFSLRPRTESD